MVSNRRPLVALIVATASISCQSTEVRPGRPGVTVVATSHDKVDLANVEASLLAREPDTAEFLETGPVEVAFRENLKIAADVHVNLVGDLAEAVASAPAPLVILVHGNHSRKEAHRNQALRLASWGYHALVLQLTNTEHWIENGRSVASLVNALGRHPDLLGPRVNAEKIILAGHSFGGSAVTVAAGSGADVRGVILLDPAVFAPPVQSYMSLLKVPVVLLGADAEIFRSKKRKQFFSKIPTEMAEVSIAGSTHDDAQNPSMFSLYAFGIDPFTSKERQQRFTAALTASVVSLSAYGDLDYAWRAFVKDLDRGDMKDAKLKSPTGHTEVIELSR